MEGSYICHMLASVLILFQFTAYMKSCSASMPAALDKTNSEYIKASCNATSYPRLCYQSLSSYANEIQTSPKLLASMALNVTLSAAKSTTIMMKNLSKRHGLRPKEAAAMRDCVEELSESVDELQKSIKEMNHTSSDFQFQMSNVETWVSAALTNDDTCTDGFTGSAVTGNVKITIRRYMVKLAHLTSNALALINNYASSQITSS